MTLPRFTFDNKISVGNIISIVVFIVLGIGGAFAFQYRLEAVEKRQDDIEQTILQSASITRVEYEKDKEIAARERASVKEEFQSSVVEIKAELIANRNQQASHFEQLTKRMDRLLERQGGL